MLTILPYRLLLGLALALSPGAALAQSAVCPGGSVTLDLSVDATPHVHMRLGAHDGNFLIDTGASASSVDARIFGLEPGSKTRIEGSSFPTVAAGDFAVFDWSHAPAPPGGLAGVIGTDFLSLRIAEFHYDAPQPYLAVSQQRCPARVFEEAGFTSISQEGYYSADPMRLRSNTLNIPVIFLRVGSVIAPAQIDSGFSESGSVRGVVQINEALFTDLRNAGVSMSPFTEVTFSIADCRGNRFVPAIWRVQGVPLQITTREGKAVFAHDSPLLEVKPTPTACGGIAAKPEPMGQIGAAYLKRWGTFVLDPFNEQVWVRQARPAP